jgi:transcriptional regulator with XRE-family HTH domain
MDADDTKLLRAVGRRIAELRAERDWTQEEFAERYRVSLKYVQNLELGTENLTLTSLARVARVLGTQIRELLVPPRSLEANRGRPRKGGASARSTTARRAVATRKAAAGQAGAKSRKGFVKSRKRR